MVKRWPIIRHIRWLYLQARFLHWWNTVGRHFGAVMNESDLDYLEKVWRGDA